MRWCRRIQDHHCDSPPTYNPVEVGRRSTRREHCFFCCPEDLCNTKCNGITSVVPPAILTTTTQTPTHHGYASTSLVQTTIPSTTHVPIQHSHGTTSVVPPAKVTTTQAPTHHDFKGMDFFLMFIRNYFYNYSQIKLRAIVTFPAPNAQLQVITRYSSTSNPVSGPVKLIDIDANMTMREIGKTSKGIIVTSNTSMSVTAFNHNSKSVDGYHAFPIESLGVSYIVGTFRQNKQITYANMGTSFAVGAPYDNTVVNITLSTSRVSVPDQYHRVGDTITVVLNRLDTFYIETHTTDQDLTGTRIVSDKPVAVVSGNICISSNGLGCNHLVEYLPPVSQWGSRFMVPPIISSTGGFIRIIPSVNNTSVFVTAQTSNKTYTISTFIDIDTDLSHPHAISSDKPVLVLLILLKNRYGMSLVPSINQFSNEPVLTSPTQVSIHNKVPFDNYIVVSIWSSDQSGLQLRSVAGTYLPRVGSVYFPNADGEMYSFISVTCNHNQTCSVQHSDDNVTFSVMSYGFTQTEAYAYPVNIML